MKTPIAAFVRDAAESEKGRLTRIATTFLDVTESVAMKLKDKGISFDRAYCEERAVKESDSYTSKIIRSGSMIVPDRIRTTLYSKNIYDLSILNDEILPEYKKRGYVLAKVNMRGEDLLKRGYVPEENISIGLDEMIKVPDLDIRLKDADKHAEQLDPSIRFAVGKPEFSGYEDIQMRFVRDYDKKRNPITLELIILMGENYAKAKHIDSEQKADKKIIRDIQTNLRQSIEFFNKQKSTAKTQKAEK